MVIGISYSQVIVVNEEMTAKHMGSGDLPVFATPSMIAIMENSSMKAVESHLATNETTVGGRIDVKHLKPTKIGETIMIKVTLEEIAGKKLTFKVEAIADGYIIGQGKHVRFIVNKTDFMNF